MENKLLPEVERILIDHINSVEQLEVLLLLYNNARDAGHTAVDWTAEAVSNELRIDEQTATERLADLTARGFLNVTESKERHYCFNLVNVEQDRTVGLLARAYSYQRVTIINFIFSREIERIRAFARAFRLREDK